MAKPVQSPARRAQELRAPKAPLRVDETAAIERIKGIEDELFERHAQVLQDAALFRDIDPSQQEPPQEWVDRLGKRDAERTYRLARAAWLPKKDAPAGFDISRSVVASMLKARVGRGEGATINIGIFMPPPDPDRTIEDEPYPIVEVEPDEG